MTFCYRRVFNSCVLFFARLGEKQHTKEEKYHAAAGEGEQQ